MKAVSAHPAGNNCVADTLCGCTMDGVFHPVSNWFEIRMRGMLQRPAGDSREITV